MYNVHICITFSETFHIALISSENFTFLLSFNTENHCVMVTLIQLICIVLIFSFLECRVELVSKELNHLAAILHVYTWGLNFMN